MTGLAAGCHAVLRLPAPVTEAAAVEACVRESVAVYGTSRYRSDGGAEPAELVLGFGNVRDSAIAEAVARVGGALAGLVR